MWPGRPPARRSTSSAAAKQPFARAEQQRRIEVALDGAVVADDGPRLVERLPPVDADDVAAGFAHDRRRIAAVPTPKWIDRHAACRAARRRSARVCGSANSR